MPGLNTSARLVGAAVLAALCASAGAAATGTPTATQRYQQERAACLNGQTHQARDVCLREAAAARGEASRGALANAGDAQAWQANAIKRCDALPMADREACQRRVQQGAVSGAVTDGGKLYESREVVVGHPAAPASAASQPK